MKKLLLLVAILLAVGAGYVLIRQLDQVKPIVRNIPTDNYFGTPIADPHRWLENDTAPEVAGWVRQQNEKTFAYLNNIPFRDQLRKRLTDLWNYERYSAPYKQSGYYIFSKNDGLQNQSVIYFQKKLTDQPQVLLDPNTLSDEGTVAVGALAFSKDGKYLAYSLSKAGSDWNVIYIRDMATGKLLDEKIEWVKFSGIAWQGNGFYFSRYDAPAKGMEYSNANEYHKVYYHRIGTDPATDALVYEDKTAPRRNFGVSVTDDEKYLVLTGSEGTSGNSLFIKDLSKKDSPFVPVVTDFDHDHDVVDHLNGRLYVITNLQAPNKRLVAIDPANPAPTNWKDIVAQQSSVLNGVSLAGKKLFLNYMIDATIRIFQYSYEGKQEREVKLPTLGNAGGFVGEDNDTEVFYSFTSFTFPTCIYRYDIRSGESTLYRQPKVDFKPEDYETKQVFYTSKDGTRVPMFVVHRKGLKMDGQNPAYLYSYGGFNISLLPAFDVRNILWLENGGVYAMPNIRGGGEYGEKWHKAGMLENKQNVFDDFIAAAEYLKAEGYTSKEKLAISGRSNGGLLVGATMTQRPDLCRVALPGVGVLDMLRYHRFTIGWAWAVEYGCADSSKTEFEYLRKYSPLHNIQEVAYPATLVVTADHDDRVVPAHSFKFIEQLQAKHRGDQPVMIRIDVNAGHGAGKPTSKVIDEWTDIWSFTYQAMGINPYAAK